MRAILFDLGNVLIQYDHNQTLAAVGTLGQCEPQQVQTLYHALSSQLGVGELSAADLLNHYRQHLPIGEDEEAFFMAFAAGLARNDAALAYAIELQQRPEVTVGIISNTNEAHAYWLDEYLPELKEFDLVVLSNEVGLAKPDPEIYRLALEILDVSAEQALFIDDIAENVAAAQSCGIAALVHHDWTLTRPAIEQWLVTGQLVQPGE